MQFIKQHKKTFQYMIVFKQNDMCDYINSQNDKCDHIHTQHKTFTSNTYLQKGHFHFRYEICSVF